MKINSKHKLNEMIESLNVSQKIKDDFLEEVKVMEKQLNYQEFRFKRTIKDKQIVTSILEQTINQLKEKSEALVIQAKELEEQSKFKEMLFANVSHELRTPLHGILGMGHLIEKTTLDPVQKGYVGIMKSSADNLLVIINDILSLSEINAGKVKISYEPFSLEQLLKELEGVLKVRTQQKGIQLSLVTPSNIPKYLIGDRTRVYQILLNLLNNAIKFTQEGFVLLSMQIIEKKADQVNLQFEIRDTGIGIKEEKLNSIFESFTRVHEENGVIYEGSGLGLNIVKTLLNLLKGSVQVESEFGKGTAFKLQIPFQIPDDDLMSEVEDNDGEEVIPNEWKQKKFLMIEDNPANILYSKDIFQLWNLNLDIAPNLKEAEILLENKYDCILSDVHLPDGNGMEFITTLRRNRNAINQKTPVVILTASANQKGVEQAKEVNIESYLSKPFPPELLIKELQQIFNLENTYIMSQEKEGMDNNIPNECQNNAQNDSTEQAFIEALSKRFKGRTGLMIEMAKIFLDQVPDITKVLEDSRTQDNFEEIRFEAHKFKSTSNIICLTTLRELAFKTEETYHNGKPEMDTTELINEFLNQVKSDAKMVEVAIEKLTTTAEV